jgi:hypothetical protein
MNLNGPFPIVCFDKGMYYLLNTHIDDPVLWTVSIGATHVQSTPISHWLDHPDVVSAVEMLQNRKVYVSIIYVCPSKTYIYIGASKYITQR